MSAQRVTFPQATIPKYLWHTVLQLLSVITGLEEEGIHGIDGMVLQCRVLTVNRNRGYHHPLHPSPPQVIPVFV